MNRIQERSLKAVPLWLMVVLAITFVCQIYLQQHVEQTQATKRPLPSPPGQETAILASLDTPTFAAQIMMLWLQSFDVQPGISLAFRELDYSRLSDWLGLILALNPGGQYPLLSASRVYAEVQDPVRQRQMLDFVAAAFEDDPDRRWPWLAHAIYVAKHRMKDIDYALALSERMAKYQNNQAIPSWARQMKIFVLEDMGEIESAKVLLGGLLESGQVTDPHEQWFLSKRLAELENQLEYQPENRAGDQPGDQQGEPRQFE